MEDSNKSDTMGKAQGKARQPNKRFQENRTSHSTDKSGKDSSRSVPLLAKKSASNLKLARKQGSTLSLRVSADPVASPVEHAQNGGSEGDGKMSKSSKEDAPHESGTDHVAATSGADARVQEDAALRTFKQTRDGLEVPETEGIQDSAMMQKFELEAGKMGPHKATLNTSGIINNSGSHVSSAVMRNGRQNGYAGFPAGGSPATKTKSEVQLLLPVVESLWRKYKAELHVDHKYFVQVFSSPVAVV